jgi:glycosyltransferase involved in cell wall biosynthesis
MLKSIKTCIPRLRKRPEVKLNILEKRNPIIYVYTIAYNEEVMIPFWLRHYSKFATKLIIYDNFSTDSTRQIITSFPNTEIKQFDTKNTLDENNLLKIKNECYKEARGYADLVIVCDVDEILYHQDIIGFLKYCLEQKITFPRVLGFQMVGKQVPTFGQIYDHIKTGVEFERESKHIIFDPLLDINFTTGAHECNPIGAIKSSEDSFLLLHYKFLSLDFVIKRYNLLCSRLSENNKTRKWGWEYQVTNNQIKNWYFDLLKKSKNILEREWKRY